MTHFIIERFILRSKTMAEKPNDIEAIYNAALKKGSEAARVAYLDAACGDDAVLRARVEELLKAHEEAAKAPVRKSVDMSCWS
jgi:hypothetical protein